MTIGRLCPTCGERKLPDGFYWRTNHSGNQSLVSSKCRTCYSAATCKVSKERTAQRRKERLDLAFGRSSLRVHNPRLASGTTRERLVLAGGGFVTVTEYHDD